MTMQIAPTRDGPARVMIGPSTDHRDHIVLVRVDSGGVTLWPEKNYSLCRFVIDAELRDIGDPPTGNICRSCREAAIEELHTWLGTPDEWREYSQRKGGHVHKNVKNYPNDDYGTHGTQVEECACGARRQTDHETGKWGEWR